MARVINSISFPRSGHHLLANALARYFGRNLSFDSDQKPTFSEGSFNYCEMYTHCRSIPCSNPQTNFQKNHDFGLRLRPRQDRFYLVQYRQMLPAIVSRFRLESSAGTIKDTESSWQIFAKTNIEYWIGFHKKWISKEDNIHRLLIDYDDLLSEPRKWIYTAIDYFAPEQKIDNRLLQQVVDSLKIVKRETLNSFEYLDKAQFLHWEQKAHVAVTGSNKTPIAGEAIGKPISHRSQLELIVQRINGGKELEALKLIEEITSMTETTPALNYGKAVALARIGRRNEAIQVLELVNAELPSYDQANWLKEELCAAIGNGPGGAWTELTHLQLYPKNFNTGLAKFIVDEIAPTSVLEFGSGLGHLAKHLRVQGNSDPVHCIEPMDIKGVYDDTHGPHLFSFDLFQDPTPNGLLTQYSLVLSIEVAEHIESCKHKQLFDFLCDRSSDWIVFSGARVGQGGHGHIAERHEADWQNEFLIRGFKFSNELTKSIRSSCDPKNVNHRKNLQVFKR